MKIVYIYMLILLALIMNGCASKEQSSYNNDSAQWQKSQAKKAIENLEKE
ncbi:MAG: hypothetical protein QG559_1764 [Campylobacterota bacterium]|nr:hypothetical protein [Campylobacterota bacterium]